MKQADSIYVGEDGAVYWRGLRADNAAAGVYTNDATVTFSLFPSLADALAASNVITGASAISMTYITASNGDYRGVLDDAVSLTNGEDYCLQVTATASGGIVGKRRIMYTARVHGGK